MKPSSWNGMRLDANKKRLNRLLPRQLTSKLGYLSKRIKRMGKQRRSRVFTKKKKFKRSKVITRQKKVRRIKRASRQLLSQPRTIFNSLCISTGR